MLWTQYSIFMYSVDSYDRLGRENETLLMSKCRSDDRRIDKCDADNNSIINMSW